MTQPLRSKNLNLIPILHALLQHESVVKAAEELNLTQPTVSGALSRLRDIYDDPILVRTGRNSQLSPLAKSLKAKVEDACLSVERVFADEQFNPEEAERNFWVAAPDYLAFLISRDIVKYLHAETPNIKIHFTNVPTDLNKRLSDRTVDLAICGDFKIWPELKRERLFKEKTLIVVANGHELLDKDVVETKDLADYPGMFYNPSYAVNAAQRRDVVQNVVPILDWDPNMQISSGQAFEQLFICAETNAVARIPRSIFNYLEKRLQVSHLAINNDEPTHYDTCLFWSDEHGRSKADIWLRNTIKDTIMRCKFIDTNIAP